MKLDIKELYTVPGNKINEDAISSSETYLFVIDGATGLSNAHITNAPSDANWFSNALKERISKAFNENDDRETKDIIYDIIEDLNNEYIALANSKNLQLPPDSPSAGIALFRIRNNKLEFYGLGDCVGVIKFKDGRVIYSRDEVLPSLDDISIKTMVNHLKVEPHKSLFDMKDKAMPVILNNRMKRNKPDGYMILDLSNDGTKKNRSLVYDLDEVEEIFVMSDGFSQLVDTFNVYKDYSLFVNDIETKSLKELTNNLFSLQSKDKDGKKYPRLKFRDDTSSGWAKIN